MAKPKPDRKRPDWECHLRMDAEIGDAIKEAADGNDRTIAKEIIRTLRAVYLTRDLVDL
jgi:hypothetical protein